MSPKLTGMKGLGFTTRELVAALAEQEIVIKAPTLNGYLSEYQAGREKATIAKSTATYPIVLKTVPPVESKITLGWVHGVSALEPSTQSIAFITVPEF